MKFDIELLQKADKKICNETKNKKSKKIICDSNSRLLMKVRILNYISKASRLGVRKEDIQKHLLYEYEIDYKKRVILYYLEELLSAELIKILDPTKLEIRYGITPLIKPSDLMNNKSNREMLKSWLEIFKVYDFLPFFIDFESTVNQLLEDYTEEEEEDAKNKTFPIVKFETRSKFPNRDSIYEFYDAVETCSEVSFKFTDYTNNKFVEIVNFQPYVIKEHKQRWYIVGTTEKENKWRAYSIGRVSNLNVSDKTFERVEVDFDDLWQHSMGIYLSWVDNKGKSSNKPKHISFEVKNGEKYNNIDYLKTRPLHSSQQIIKRKNSEYTLLRLKMFPDTDLVRSIRSIGLHNVRNIKPDFFREWVING